MNSDDRAGCSSSRSDHGDDHHRVGPNRAIDAGVPSISPFIRHRQSYSLFRNTPSPHMTSPHPPRSPRERTTTTSPHPLSHTRPHRSPRLPRPRQPPPRAPLCRVWSISGLSFLPRATYHRRAAVTRSWPFKIATSSCLAAALNWAYPTRCTSLTLITTPGH